MKTGQESLLKTCSSDDNDNGGDDVILAAATPNPWIGYTKLFIIFIIILIALWDILVFWKGGKDATISVIVRQWASANPILAFALGIVAGHIFWRD